MKTSLRIRAALLSVLLLLVLTGIWQIATTSSQQTGQTTMTPEQIEYAKLMGQPIDNAAPAKNNGFPTPRQFAETAAHALAHPFYDNGPNDKGIGIQLAWSLLRVLAGYLLAACVAIPAGFLIGTSPLVYRALDPFIQILKPISPLAWMPIALYTIKNASISAIFVIFICSLWPMLINTAFGVANVRKDWLNVARTLEVAPLRKAFRIILPAAAPTILTGMRISMGIAWLVIVAAEMLVGSTGIGYFVWNEWNNLSLSHVIFAVLIIGVVGMLLDLVFASIQKKVTYVE
ncbi:MAG TPA: nitrate ABC transporter permease [Paraburkholderia sp.]|jgi:nitrate/nitrite transport system permease protein|nr:nitrate ABC transporter permease [Paraburkholderia sp.]